MLGLESIVSHYSETYTNILKSTYFAAEMRMLIHQQLEKKLEEYGHTAQLNEIVFQSFHLHWGYRTPLSATDAVYGISALMESHNTRPYDNLEGADTFW